MTDTVDLQTSAQPQGDRGVLHDFWHPVARAADVDDQPLPVTLLGEPLVIWRSGGQPFAFYDLCIHRGTPLSLGSLRGDRLVCGYHGWEYAASGACIRIPSLPEGSTIPSKARARDYPVVERYGLLWVCLGEPRADIPALPEAFSDPAFRWSIAVQPLRANAARSMENAMDLSHFAFVHAGILAVDPVVPPMEVNHTEDGLTYRVENPGNTLDDDGLEDEGPREQSDYRLILPFTLIIDRYKPWAPERRILVFVNAPVTSRETIIYRFACSNYSRYSDEQEQQRAQTLFEQDRRVVEAQRPEELPLDLREELHLKGPDAAGLAYRKLLAGMGVHWG